MTRPAATDQGIVTLAGDSIATLIELLEGELGDILDALNRGISDAIQRAESAAASDDLAALFQAAHSGLNDAMLVGARELGSAFEALADAAREHRRAEVRTALARVRATWPRTRAAIERLAEVAERESGG